MNGGGRKRARAEEAGNGAPHALSVIEVGTTSVRMAIAQTDAEGRPHILESLQQPISLGKDTFTQGRIDLETTEKCVRALQAFDRKLKEYRIEDRAQLRVVATSAVREAANRDAFLDRLYVATGLDVEPLDDSEISRLMYLAVRPLVAGNACLRAGNTLVVEVGGGSTEVLQLRQRKVIQAHTFRLGSLRLRELLEESRIPLVQSRDVLLRHVDRDVRQIVDVLVTSRSSCLLALGGDARLAATRLVGAVTSPEELSIVPTAALTALTDAVLRMSVDEAVRQFHISYPDAETLGPALLIYSRLVDLLRVRRIQVGQATLRDGLLRSMVADKGWTSDSMDQIVTSALDIGKRYGFDQRHAENVTACARHLFHELQAHHRLASRYERVLTVASLLHDIGWFVSTRSHHKHSMYLIQHIDIFGLGSSDQLLAALVARYHRKASPLPAHEGFNLLDREHRAVVAKLAAILRVADALDRRHGRARDLPAIRFEPGRMVVSFRGEEDLTLEKYALKAKGQMFREVYGMEVILQASGRASHED